MRARCVCYNYICIAQTHLFYVSHKFVWGCANKLSAYIFLLGLRNVHNLCNSIFIRFSFLFLRFFGSFFLIKMRERRKHLHLSFPDKFLYTRYRYTVLLLFLYFSHIFLTFCKMLYQQQKQPGHRERNELSSL